MLPEERLQWVAQTSGDAVGDEWRCLPQWEGQSFVSVSCSLWERGPGAVFEDCVIFGTVGACSELESRAAWFGVSLLAGCLWAM